MFSDEAYLIALTERARLINRHLVWTNKTQTPSGGLLVELAVKYVLLVKRTHPPAFLIVGELVAFTVSNKTSHNAAARRVAAAASAAAICGGAS